MSPIIIENIDYSTFPTQHMVKGLRNYLEMRIMPGSFLEYMLCGKFDRAKNVADHKNIHHIDEIISWLKKNIPNIAWGTTLIYYEWLKGVEYYRPYNEFISKNEYEKRLCYLQEMVKEDYLRKSKNNVLAWSILNNPKNSLL